MTWLKCARYGKEEHNSNRTQIFGVPMETGILYILIFASRIIKLIPFINFIYELPLNIKVF